MGVSTSIYVSDDVYEHALETKDEDQSVHQRIAELADAGRKAERRDLL